MTLQSASPATTSAPVPLWTAHKLYVSADDGTPILEDINLEISRGERVAVLGDRGAGKSALAMTLLGLWESDVTVTGVVNAYGTPYLDDSERVQSLRRDTFGWVPQGVSRALCPHVRIGRQLMDVHQLAHHSKSKVARAAALDALVANGVADAEDRLNHLPHRLSLAQRQRVVLAMAQLLDAKLLVADEPTSALDATSQARVMHALSAASRDADQALLLLTHDPAIAWLVAERVVVMHGGMIVEQGPCAEVLTAPRHPMTEALLAAVPPLRDGLSPGGRYERPDTGCTFAPECSEAVDTCTETTPPLVAIGNQRRVRCPVRVGVK